MTQTASIHNLELVRIAAERLTYRSQGLPGIAVLAAPAGYGKTTAALAVANETRGYFVQMRSAWSRKTLLEKILVEMSIGATGTIPALLDKVCSQLAASRRLLIIDEADYLLKSPAMLDLVRDIYEGSQTQLLLIGMERFPDSLRRHEQFHSRVLTWIRAEPVSLSDARLLAPIYCNTPVADCFLSHLVRASHGSVRRVCINLFHAAEQAALEGWDVITHAAWGNRPIYTGEAPARGA